MTPEQILEQKFRTTFRGYDATEVRVFVGKVAEVLRSIMQEHEAVRAHAATLEAQQRASQEMEIRLQDMLHAMEGTSAAIIEQSRNNAAALSAHSEHERIRMKEQARDEAALILRDAERKAQRIVDDADARRADALEEIGLLHSRRAMIVARIKSLLASQVEFLRAIERDMHDPTGDVPTFTRDTHPRDGIGAAELQSIIAKLDTRDMTRQ